MSVVDESNFFEIQPFYAPNIVIGFGKLRAVTL
jgi:acetyl-CoA carboxylase carboxyltransferase component